MKQSTQKIVAGIRQLAATMRAERETRRKMFPKLDQGLEVGYSFGSLDEMVESYTNASLDLDADLVNLMSAAVRLPKPYGDMFCYLAYGDLHRRMKMYQKLADELAKLDETEPSSEALDPAAAT